LSKMIGCLGGFDGVVVVIIGLALFSLRKMLIIRFESSNLPRL